MSVDTHPAAGMWTHLPCIICFFITMYVYNIILLCSAHGPCTTGRPQCNAYCSVTACPSETKTPSSAQTRKRPGSPLTDEQAKKLRLEEVKLETMLKVFCTTECASCDAYKCRFIELINYCKSFSHLFVFLQILIWWIFFHASFPYKCNKIYIYFLL